jgi:hypothetical protein
MVDSVQRGETAILVASRASANTQPACIEFWPSDEMATPHSLPLQRTSVEYCRHFKHLTDSSALKLNASPKNEDQMS